ncbi:hypothetical protein P7K49_007911 [Saguinus oedipus]|uniref:Uncharacterized protein n=1 Tax=Saguinus oedipus TaxID=9490 RepID=A0ABQ9VW80_SAGOE|nr:hypothetical protein P7K49_007911 [Saguinus oedipus]
MEQGPANCSRPASDYESRACFSLNCGGRVAACTLILSAMAGCLQSLSAIAPGSSAPSLASHTDKGLLNDCLLEVRTRTQIPILCHPIQNTHEDSFWKENYAWSQTSNGKRLFNLRHFQLLTKFIALLPGYL